MLLAVGIPVAIVGFLFIYANIVTAAQCQQMIQGNKIEISDTQRYKMAGNGVVSNVVKWLIENVILRE